MSKWFLASKTLWGGAIAIVPGLLPLIGVDIPDVEIQALGTAGNALLDAGNLFIGAALVIWGRFTATKPITLARSS